MLNGDDVPIVVFFSLKKLGIVARYAAVLKMLCSTSLTPVGHSYLGSGYHTFNLLAST